MNTRPSAVVAALVLAACATTSPPGPADIPALEASLRSDSTSVSARVRLAAALREAGDVQRAVSLLEPVVRADPDEGIAALYLGLSYEDAGRTAEARQLYESFLRTAPSSTLRRRVESRIELLGRLELREAARAALQREQELAATPPQPRTAGVFPFLFAGADSTLRPLGRALSELLSVDLAQTSRLRVLERSRIQALIDEMELAQSGLVDPSTAARTGYIVSAATIIQGRLEGGEADLALEAVVVPTATDDSTFAPLREQGGIARLFDMEKQLALSIYSQLGIQLTAAERERVNRRATENVQALLAFGLGLEASDAGRWAEAARHFARAAQLDPRFVRARELTGESDRIGSVAGGGTRLLARLAANEFDLGLSTWQRRRLDVTVLESMIPDPQLRDPTVEVLGIEGLDRGTVIDIIIRRPAGGS